ncbi:hypothetical protein [Nonomuraea typhae]|uniref:Uncharacterized protein n=1 Tax=Nonomuraea typhae TaxID=2603600 RepID=A0ABW7YZX0_9ACTN
MNATNTDLRPAIVNPLRHLLELLDRRAFAELDRRARAQGWQVIRPSLLTRVYRNRNFDSLSPCAACAGEGVTVRGACRTCVGSGRVRS